MDRQHELIDQIAGLFRAERLFTSILDSSLKETGLTAREVYMLTLLAETPTSIMPISDMTNALLIPKSVTTTRIQSLEKRGLVVRQEDRNDHRRVFIILTAKGQRIQQIALGILMSSADGWISRHLVEDDNRFLDRINEIVVLVNADRVLQKERRKREMR